MRHLFLMAALVGCGDKDDSGSSDAAFEAGSFQFTSTAVDDYCLQGGFSALLLPEGDGSENDWAYPIELPAWDALPATYTIQIQDPFSSMEITVTEGGTDQFAMDGAEQTGVVFNEDSYPDCLVDMDISATINIESSDSVEGNATLSITGSSGDTCPVFKKGPPCNVELDFYGTRL